MKQYRYPTNYPRGMSTYVPAMSAAVSLDDALQGIVDFGTPNLAVADAILAAGAVGTTYGLGNTAFNGTVNTAAAGFTRSDGQLTDCPWGRSLTMVASGAGTNNVTITGYDHLGQLVQKVIALNGATPVPILVAFKYINTIAIASGGAITVNVGFGGLLGLPYKTSSILAEWADGAKTATTGTLTNPVTTDPATNATLDPRGLITPNTTLDGVKRVQALILGNNWVNAAGNGGLHGIRHFGG